MLITAMLVVAVACAPRAADPSPTSASSATSAPTVAAATSAATTAPGAPSTAQPATTGTITGVSGYPSEAHPAVTIYAISTTDRGVYYSVDIPRTASPPKPSFTITGLRPGTYNLFAYAEGNNRAGGAYTEYVKCGLRASCSDHTLIAVTVRAGETVRDIEVSDWYAPSDSWPPRPR